MAVLAKDAILKAMDEGKIKVEPFHLECLGPASIDLTLSNEFRLFKPGQGIIHITDDNFVDYKKVTELTTLKQGEHILLPPGQSCLGITQEKICLSPEYCGLLEGRSRFARLGLFVHITAGFMQPGIENRQVLEIYNASPNPLALHPGTRVCQFVFMKMEGKAKYAGIFADQTL